MKKLTRHLGLSASSEIAFAHWEHVTAFPLYMKFVKRVTQTDRLRSAWSVGVGEIDWEYDAIITSRKPGESLVWKTTGELRLLGSAKFTSVDGASSVISLRLYYQPVGVLERIGSLLGIDSLVVGIELLRFRRHVETLMRQSAAPPLLR